MCWMTLSRVAIFALLPSCAQGLASVDPHETDSPGDADTDADADADSDSDVDLERLTIQRLEPTYGSNAGGYEATIRGGPFDASANVAFVGPEASASADIVSATADELVVRVPQSIDVGQVEVRITTDTHTGKKPDAFRYYADGVGKYGVIGGVEWYHVLGTYWSDPPPRDSGFAYVYFIEPQTAGYVELYFHPNRAGDGGCTNEYGATAGSVALWDGMVKLDPQNTELKLASADHPPIAMTPDAVNPWFYSTALMPADYVDLWSYNLMPVDIGGDLPRFSLEGIARTPEPINVTMPDLTGATAPAVRKAMQLAWDPPTGSDPSYVVAMLDRLDVDTGEIVESVTCYIRDDGTFTVPQASWTAWPEGAQISIYVGRVTESAVSLPYNNAKNGVVGAYYVRGAGYATP